MDDLNAGVETSRGGVFGRMGGVWRSHGYGTVLEIGPTEYRLYEETAVSCLCVFAGSLQELAEFYVDVRVSPRGQAFSARRATGVTRVVYRRLKTLPRVCEALDHAWRRDPIHNFDVFWHTFAERYALFELRGVNWRSVYTAYRPLVAADTGMQRLFEIFIDMLRPLGDGHVELRTPLGHFNAGGTSAPQRRLAKRLRRAADDWSVWTRLMELSRDSRVLIRERYLLSRAGRCCNQLFEWGQLSETTGYLAIEAMAGLCGKANRAREDQRAAAAGINRALGDLSHLPALVIDVRRNLGGYDGVSLRIAGSLTDRKRLAFVKAPSKGGAYGGKQSIFVEPRGKRRYHGRIFLLTSGLTASAAEIFVLALFRHPRVTRIGEPTHGELSDVMERHLPNGWYVTLSNELYRAADGELYEDRGVPPHVEIPFLNPMDVEAGRDPALDYVLSSSSI